MKKEKKEDKRTIVQMVASSIAVMFNAIAIQCSCDRLPLGQVIAGQNKFEARIKQKFE